MKIIIKRECMPVGCRPPAGVAITGGLYPPRAGTPWPDPLNFPIGCGPGPDPPQLPPWLWAWTRSPSTSPLGVGLETPQPDPLNFPLGCGPGNLQGMLGYHPPWKPAARHAGIPPAMHAGIAPSPPPLDRQTRVKT